MPTTPNLEVEHILQSQAQKEETANEGFTVFDAALSEISIAMSDANYTLSALTTPKEWQYGVIKLTGTLTAGRNVICPTNKKHYIVVNATSGGFAVTFKTSGGTGVAVQAGKASFVRCDGVNVAQVSADTEVGYDVGAFFPNQPGASAKVLKHVFTRSVQFPSGLTGSAAKAGTAATAQTDFDIQKNGSSVGTMRFAAAATTATFIFSSAQTFNATDFIDIVAPATPDATLADIAFTLKGTRL